MRLQPSGNTIESIFTETRKLWDEVKKGKEPTPTLDTSFGTILTVGIVFGIPANFICCYFFATQKSSNENGIYFKRIYTLISSLDLAICISLFPVIQAFLTGRQSDSLLFYDTYFCHIWYSLWAVSQQMVIFMVAMLSVSRLAFLKYPHIQAKPSAAWIFPGMVAGVIATILIVFPLASGKATISYRPAYSSCQIQGNSLELGSILDDLEGIPKIKMFMNIFRDNDDATVSTTDLVKITAPQKALTTATAETKSQQVLSTTTRAAATDHIKRFLYSTAPAETQSQREGSTTTLDRVQSHQEFISLTTDASEISSSTSSANLAPDRLIHNPLDAERVYNLSAGVGENIDETLLNQRTVVLLRTSLFGLPVLPIFISFILCWFWLKRAEAEAKKTNATVMKHGQASSTVLIVTLVYVIFNIPALMYSIYLVYDYTQNISIKTEFFDRLNAVLVAGHEFAPEGSDVKAVFQTGAENRPDLKKLLLDSFEKMAFWLSDIAERLKYERKYAAVSFVVLPVLYSCLYPAVVFWRLLPFRDFVKNGLKHPVKALPQTRYKAI